MAGLVAVLALVAAMSVAVTTAAEAHRHAVRHRERSGIPSTPTDPSKDAALIIDGVTGKVLYARNPNEERHPASLTKMMTLYLLFDALKKGQISLNSTMPVSAHAAAQKPTNLHLHSGDQINVDLAIKAIVVRSANDVAVVIAEALGGTEGHFAEMMTEKARALGMRNTFYHNASGLPDNLQITTATDLGVLARHLAYDFPQYFHYFSTPAFSFRGTEYVTHDNLIGRYRGADGIKTGYTGASGFNLVSSVVRDNVHIIGVVMGGRTAPKRDREMVRLLDTAFGAVGRNPTLVARAQAPWQVAINTLPSPSVGNSGNIVALQAGPPSEGDDEDTAERRADMDDAQQDEGVTPPAPVVAYNQPRPQAPLALAPRTQGPAVPTPQPSLRPTVTALQQAQRPAPALNQARPAVVAATVSQRQVAPSAPPPSQIALASLQPKSAPPRPAMRPVILGEGDVGGPGAPVASFGMHDWTIQIGAFADLNLARTQLAAYAEKSMDILGQAQRIVVPFQSVDGHTLYRARFGPFVEREARQICSRLTERGQTCFAAISTR